MDFSGSPALFFCLLRRDRVSVLFIIYIHPLKEIFCLNHQNSLLYIEFLRTHHPLYYGSHMSCTVPLSLTFSLSPSVPTDLSLLPFFSLSLSFPLPPTAWSPPTPAR
jgi:hypothetical protein